MPTVTFAHLDSMMRIVVEPRDASEEPKTERPDEAEPKAELQAGGRAIEAGAARASKRAAESAPPSQE